MKRILIALALLLAAVLLWLYLKNEAPAPPGGAAGDEATEEAAVKPRLSTPSRKVPGREPMPEGDFEDDPAGQLSLQGQVVDEQGNGVPGATVALSSNPRRSVVSGEHGWFSFEGLVGRGYWLEARKGEAYGVLATQLSAESTPVTIRLERGATLTVTVLDALDRRPISGARVSFGALAPTTSTTDGEGRAILQGLRGWEMLRTVADGYGPSYDFVQAGEAKDLEKTVTLEPGAAVSGVVLDPAGAPVAGARVTIQGSSGFASIGEQEDDKILTDAQGRWQFAALSAGTFRFRARHGTFAPGISEPVTLDGETPRAGIEIRLEEGGAVSGRVVDSSGAAVAGALVRVRKDGQEIPWERTRQAYCDERGEFRIEGLPRAPLALAATFEGASSGLVKADLSGAAEQGGVLISLDQDGVITGVVVSGAGAPVPEAEVVGFPKNFTEGRDLWRLRGLPRATADADGRFELRGVPAETELLLSASRPGEARGRRPGEDSVPARAGAKDIKLVLKDEGGVRGRIVFADGRAPASFTILSGRGEPSPFKDTNGEFELKKLAPGKTRLSVRGPDFREKSFGPIEIRAGQVVDAGTITVEGGRSLRGRVRSEDGAPVAGALILAGRWIGGSGGKLREDENWGPKRTTSGEDGSFVLSGLEEEGLLVAAEHPAYGRSEVVAIPDGAGEVSRDLELLAGGALEGTISRAGEPIEGFVSVSSAESKNSNFSVRSGPDGLYRFDKLTPGRYYVTAGPVRVMGGARPGLRSELITIEANKTTRQDIDIPPGVSLTIRLSQGGQPLTDARLALLLGQHQATDTKALEAVVRSIRPDSSHFALIRKQPGVSIEAAKFEDIVPGSYTLCVDKLPSFEEAGDLSNDPDEVRPVSCSALEVPASPERQEITREIP